MNKKINEALEYIPDSYIQEAAVYRKRRLPRYFGAIAAVLALVILVAALKPWGGEPVESTDPASYGMLQIGAPHYPKMAPHREWGEDGRDEWEQGMKNQYNQPDGYADNLERFFKESIPEFLAAADGENAVCSPVNVYMAMAMLAECTAGNSQKQILDLLGAESMEALRLQVSYVWNAHYRDDGLAKLLMANSLWLDDAYSFKQETVDILADKYYVSVFHGDLGTDAASKALRAWINAQTGGLLQEQTDTIKLDPLTILALASTIEYRVNWSAGFEEEWNTEDVFHGTQGNSTTTFMHQSLENTYYMGSDFTAVDIHLQDGGRMWLILPNEGVTPGQLLAQGIAVDMAIGNYKNVESNCVMLNLSLPKFDVNSQANLIPAMKNLGVTDVFSSRTADFSNMIIDAHGELAPFVSTIDHGARVSIDEKGVTGVAYTLIVVENGGTPGKTVDFILDRPFLFVITSPDGLPLFTGVVNAV